MKLSNLATLINRRSNNFPNHAADILPILHLGMIVQKSTVWGMASA